MPLRYNRRSLNPYMKTVGRKNRCRFKKPTFTLSSTLSEKRIGAHIMDYAIRTGVVPVTFPKHVVRIVTVQRDRRFYRQNER